MIESTAITEWRLDYNPNGEPIYSSSTTAERYGKKNGEFSYVIDNHTSGTSAHWGVDPTTHKLGGKLFTDSLDSSYYHSASGSYDYEQTVTGRAAAGSSYYTTTSVLGEESGSIQNSSGNSGVSNGTRVLYQTDHEHTSYSSSSGNGRSFELAWSGVPTVWSGERTVHAWNGDQSVTTVEPLPDPGWPYYHPHEEWPARPYHGGTPYVMAPAPPASQTIATAHVPDGPTRLDIPGSHYSKPVQKYRPGDNEFRNYNIVLPNGMVCVPPQQVKDTPPSEISMLREIGKGLMQGLCNIPNGLQDIAIGLANLCLLPQNVQIWGINKILGTDLPQPWIESPDWSRDKWVPEAGEEGTWSDTHGWSKFAGANGILALWAAWDLAGTTLGSARLSELPGKMWDGLRGGYNAARSWAKGAPKEVKPPALELVKPSIRTTENNPGLKELLKAGEAPDRNMLNKAGRALQKHGDRPGSSYPKITGSPDEVNKAGMDVLKTILNSTKKRIVQNKYGGIDIYDTTTGWGARYNSLGEFMGFLKGIVE